MSDSMNIANCRNAEKNQTCQLRATNPASIMILKYIQGAYIHGVGCQDDTPVLKFKFV